MASTFESQADAADRAATGGRLTHAREIVAGLAHLNPWHNLELWGRNPKQDILAGVTVAVISVPMAMAFGVASGLGAAAGIWATICGGLLVGLFGGSTTGVSGPTSPKVVQLAIVMQAHVLASGRPDLGYAFTLVFFSGLVVTAMSLLRLGRFVYYTPYSVVSGFMCGIGLILILLQINPLLGIAGAKSLRGAVLAIPHALMIARWPALLISLATFASVVFWDRAKPLHWLPGPLVGLAAGTAVAGVLGLDVPYVSMNSGLPALWLPRVSMVGSMVGPACALAGLCLFDSLMTCLVCDAMTDDRHDSNRELLGQGIANMACGLIGGVTTATATMRSVANIKSGARSSLACFAMGATMLALMLGLAPLASSVPMACLAAILLKVGLDILDYRVLPVLRRLPPTDKLCFWVVLVLTIWADLLIAVGVGLAIALLRFVEQMSAIHSPTFAHIKLPERSPELPQIAHSFDDRVATVRCEGPLFFGHSDAMSRVINRLGRYEVLIVDVSRVSYIDLSGAFLIDDLYAKAAAVETDVLLVGVRSEILRVLDDVRVSPKIGEERLFSRLDGAIAELQRRFSAEAYAAEAAAAPPERLARSS